MVNLPLCVSFKDMDPLQVEITKYKAQKDLLCERLMKEEESLAEFLRRLYAFEQEFLSQLAPLHQQIERWEQRCLLTEKTVQHLEHLSFQNILPPTEVASLLSITQHRNDTPLPSTDAPRILDSEEQKEAKKLFRQLARRFHPDLIDLPEVKRQRQEVMSEINEAYRSGDLEALRALKHHPEIRLPENETVGEQWERIVREISLLRHKIEDCKDQFNTISQSEVAMFMHLNEQDQSSFKQLEALLKEKIQRLQRRWIRLRQEEEEYWIKVDGL